MVVKAILGEKNVFGFGKNLLHCDSPASHGAAIHG